MATEGHANPVTRRQAALALADELLADIELGRIQAIDVARKAVRLARLLDDSAAVAWLGYETGGYPKSGLDESSIAAASRSHRQGDLDAEGRQLYWTRSLGELQLEADGATAQIAAAAGSGTS